MNRKVMFSKPYHFEMKALKKTTNTLADAPSASVFVVLVLPYIEDMIVNTFIPSYTVSYIYVCQFLCVSQVVIRQ